MTNEEQAVLDSVVQLLKDYSRKDLDSCMQGFSASRRIFVLGTNKNEILGSADEIRAAFRRDFEHMSDISWGEPNLVHVVAEQELAGVMLELPIRFKTDGKTVKTLFRYALTLAKEAGQWKIFCGMASVPFPAGTYEFTE